MSIKFRVYKDSLIDQSQRQVASMIATMQALRDNMISFTMDTNVTWPLVVIPDFEARHVDFVNGDTTHTTTTTTSSTTSTSTSTTTSSTRGGVAVELAVLPLVTVLNRRSWEDWASLHSDWIGEGIQFRAIYSNNNNQNQNRNGSSEETAVETLKNGANEITPYIHNGVTTTTPTTDPMEEVELERANAPSTTTTGHDFFLPIWQTSPVPSDPKRHVNFDTLAVLEFQQAFQVLQETKCTVLSKVLSSVPTSSSSTGVDAEGQDGVVNDEEEKQFFVPQSYLLEPIFDRLVVTTARKEKAKLVGVLRTTVDWSALFQDVLPLGANGVVVVLSNTCGQVYSFQVNGPDTLYLGVGDLHDINHAALKTAAPIVPPNNNNNNTVKAILSSYCPYTVTIYPSSELQRSYDSNDPFFYTTAVVFIFLVATCLFGCYDYMVERRQGTIATTAARSKALVSSLFPEQVHSRLMNDGVDPSASKATSAVAAATAAATTAMRSNKRKESHAFHQNNVNNSLQHPKVAATGIANRTNVDHMYNKALKQQQHGGGGGEQSVLAFHSKPIADLFPSTTVMFCDIVNFTAWSSVREPTQVSVVHHVFIFHSFIHSCGWCHLWGLSIHMAIRLSFRCSYNTETLVPSRSLALLPPPRQKKVFSLLEAVYKSFDMIAKRRRVFKVETIGDSYVAVCGLPDPRPNHAPVMSRFAHDCALKFREVVKKLDVSLGYVLLLTNIHG
jgi:hypothetical protein